MEQDVLIAATLAAGLFPRAPNLDAQKATQIYFDVLDALQTERPKHGIALVLAARGIPTAQGGAWTPVQVSAILQRAKWTLGDVKYQIV